MRFCVFVCAVVISIGSCNIVAQSQITGVVVDSVGTPISGAFVQAIPRGNNETAGTFGSRVGPWARADNDGKFSLKLPDGKYRIVAKAEHAGYPDPSYLLNSESGSVFPDISVKGNVADILVRLSGRGGVLKGSVKDQGTSQVVPGAKITVRDAKNPAAYVEYFADKNGEYEIAVPPKSVLVSVDAPGYSKVEYEGGSGLHISGGQVLNVDFDLRAN